MWPFRRAATVEEIRGHKRITVNGMKFVIRKVNPLLDFPGDKVPQIFTDFVSRRPEAPQTTESVKKAMEDTYAVLRAGVVDPVIEPEEAKAGIKASDLFRDPTMGPTLFIEIVAHSLNMFRGVKGFFFSLRIKQSLWIPWLRDMGERRRRSLSQQAVSA